MSGAAFSGYSAEPYGRVPLFGRMGILDRYPYALPGFVILGCSILSSLGVAFLVPEVSESDLEAFGMLTWYRQAPRTDRGSTRTNKSQNLSLR